MEPTPVQQLSYAPSRPLTSGRLWAATVLAMTGLGLIALGGCFLIGILVLFDPALAFGPTNSLPVWSWGTYTFAGALSILAGICFISAAWLLFLTARNLLRSLAAPPVQSVEVSQ
jgi:hypothetical protein